MAARLLRGGGGGSRATLRLSARPAAPPSRPEARDPTAPARSPRPGAPGSCASLSGVVLPTGKVPSPATGSSTAALLRCGRAARGHLRLTADQHRGRVVAGQRDGRRRWRGDRGRRGPARCAARERVRRAGAAGAWTSARGPRAEGRRSMWPRSRAARATARAGRRGTLALGRRIVRELANLDGAARCDRRRADDRGDLARRRRRSAAGQHGSASSRRRRLRLRPPRRRRSASRAARPGRHPPA